MSDIIHVSHLTKDYKKGKGVFDLSFSVGKGEAFGFLGPNGAGKTTTIRQLMGFIRPTSGTVSINGMDCFLQAATIQKDVGYLPGELPLPEDLTGEQFISFIAKLKGISDIFYAHQLMQRFQLDGKQKMRKMSKGTRQKVGIVAAFMGQPQIFILDEPTSGLDPLMQNEFIQLVLEQKAKGCTIFLSSHIFEEVERTCDRVAILRKGKIVSIQPIDTLRHQQSREFHFSFSSKEGATAFYQKMGGTLQEKTVILLAGKEQLLSILQMASSLDICDLSTKSQSLEDTFLAFYGEEQK